MCPPWSSTVAATDVLTCTRGICKQICAGNLDRWVANIMKNLKLSGFEGVVSDSGIILSPQDLVINMCCYVLFVEACLSVPMPGAVMSTLEVSPGPKRSACCLWGCCFHQTPVAWWRGSQVLEVLLC